MAQVSSLPRRHAARAIAVAILAAASLHAESESAERLRNAAEVFHEIMRTPDQAIPQDLLDKASCIAVVPGVKKGAFLFGAKYGKGYISCRRKSGVGWTAPGSVRIEGGSFGFQIGGSETDLVLLVMNDSGAQRLLSSQFTLGGAAEVAAGPVGRAAKAATGAFLTAQILSWSRSRGVFAGISLQGATLRQDLDDNEELYGKRVENREIIEKELPVPKEAKKFISDLNKWSGRQ